MKRRAIAVSLLGVLGVDPVVPAVITVQGSCSLVEAMRAANNDAPEGACPAGSGPDTIVLTEDVTLTAVDVVDVGSNGLPTVTSEITIDGRNHTVERDPFALNEFRIAKINPSGSLTVERATVTGGIEVSGGAFRNSGALALRNSTLSFNKAESTGGAVYNGIGADFEIYRSVISDNRAVGDGGHNFAFGGAIINFGHLTIRESTLNANRAGTNPFLTGPAEGGAVWTSYYEMRVYDSTFSANQILYGATESGSAIHVDGGLAEMTNSTITFNGSSSILVSAAALDSLSTTTLTNVTMSGNSDFAIRAPYGYITLASTIVANTNGPNCSGFIIDDLNNVADDTSCGTIPGGLTGLDPIRADNGGPTVTHALLAGSNAIDAAGFCSLPNDQRGAPRVGACDIGAFEYMGCPVLPLADDTIETAVTHEDCSIEVGPNVAVVGPGGALTLRFGSTASFGDDFSVGTGAELAVEHDPSLQLLHRDLIEADRARRREREPAPASTE